MRAAGAARARARVPALGLACGQLKLYSLGLRACGRLPLVGKTTCLLGGGGEDSLRLQVELPDLVGAFLGDQLEHLEVLPSSPFWRSPLWTVHQSRRPTRREFHVVAGRCVSHV